MKTSLCFGTAASRVSAFNRLHRFASILGVIVSLVSLSSSLRAQAPGSQNNDGRRRGEGGGDRGNFNPQEAQARMLSALRERLEVTDDEEWKLISDRIAKLAELRRNAAGAGIVGFAMFGGRGGPPGGGDRGGGPPGGGDRGGRGGPRPGGGSPELSALSSALRDKLPDAELKQRLERLREVRKDNEAKLTKAQEELRAVLSIRQEAVAVVFGLLP